MAKKKKDKKSGTSAKTPKKVAGAKVPKRLRQAGDVVSSVLTSPMARELVADALIAIAGVLVSNKGARRAVAEGAGRAGSSAKDLGRTATGAVAEVVAETARRILPSTAMDEGKGEQSGRAEGSRGAQSRKRKGQDKTA